MQTVGVTEGIAYGFRIMIYYLGVVLAGNILAGVGGGAMIASGFSDRGSNSHRAKEGTRLVGSVHLSHSSHYEVDKIWSR